MQRIIQINIAGRILPIEEDAYLALKDYISSLDRQFPGADGKEIVADIENRIAELFAIRLQSGSPAIDRYDVKKVTDTLGAASDLHDGGATTGNAHTGSQQNTSSSYSAGPQKAAPNYPYARKRLLRDPYDKMIGGVCSGISHYFDVDVTIIRLVGASMFFTFGIGVLVYAIACMVIPAAKTREELYNMNNGNSITFHDITQNVGMELADLKRRGEQMSRELRDFFGKKR